MFVRIHVVKFDILFCVPSYIQNVLLLQRHKVGGGDTVRGRPGCSTAKL